MDTNAATAWLAGGPPRPRTTLVCTFTVPGPVVPMLRTKFVRNTGIAYTPAKSRNYLAVVRDYAALEMAGRPPHDGPCELCVIATFIAPPSWPKRKRQNAEYKSSKPDLDNIWKLVADACNGIVFTDDARIVQANISKPYGEVASLYVCVNALGA